MIGTLPVSRLVSLEYRYALDAAMALLPQQPAPLARCSSAALRDEMEQRLPARVSGPAPAALWVEPPAETWRADLYELAGNLLSEGMLVIIASRPPALMLPERRGWRSWPLGVRPGGLMMLRRALRQTGFSLHQEYGIHTINAIILNQLGQQAARNDRLDLGDRLEFAARLRYRSSGPLAGLSTVALIVARKL